VATMICLVRYVLPALRAMTGAAMVAAERFATSQELAGRKMPYFMPVRLGASGAGTSQALPRPPHGSGDFLALAGTDGFIELPPQPQGYPAGFIADFYRW
jgi:molybdopterin molybdotransferase